VYIEEALELAQRWLRNQEWWSDKTYAVTCVRRDEAGWVVSHSSRDYAETADDLYTLIGGYGPLVVTTDGQIIPAEPDCGVVETGVSIETMLERVVKVAEEGHPRPDRES
jgi:Immunity protein 35